MPASSGDPLTVRIGFTAAVPKDGGTPAVEGVMTVKLARGLKGGTTATVLNVKAGREEPAPRPAAAAATKPAPAPAPRPARSKELMQPDDFAKIRAAITDKSRTKAWKVVQRDLPTPAKGQQVYVKAWVEANVVQKLTHVDSRGDNDEVVSVFFWQEGVVMSVSKFYKGWYTENPAVNERTETYKFQNGRLVSSQSDPGGVRDPQQKGYQDLGQAIQKQAIQWSQPIYQAIGAD